jgi:predicted RNA polymerase sigma factor
MAEGPVKGLTLIDEIEATGELAGYHLLHAARADLLRREGRAHDAALFASLADALPQKGHNPTTTRKNQSDFTATS